MDENQVKSRMDEAVEALKQDMGTIRTGRVTSALVENLMIEAYGGTQRMAVREVANVTVQDAQTLLIEPWDKSIIGDIKKGILGANIGMNPAIDGEIIRISVPPLTTEDREKYVKLLLGKLENARISIRQIRGETMKDIKKLFEDKTISEDVRHVQEKKLQEMTDQSIEKIDSLGDAKVAELRKV